MKTLSAFRYLQWSMFSKPVCDRSIFKLIKRNKVRSMVEIGLQDGQRCQRMIQVAQKFGAGNLVKYTGIDLFDGRDAEAAPLKLIQVHKQLSALGVKPQLVPGDLAYAIRKIANSHTRTDLVVLSAGFDEAAMEANWQFIPRMLHAGSAFMIQREKSGSFSHLSRLEIERLAGQPADRVAA